MHQERLFDLGPVTAAQGALRSRGRRALLVLLQDTTRDEVGRNVRCSGEFVSQCASGRKAPQRYHLRRRFEAKYGILADWWDKPEVDETNHS